LRIADSDRAVHVHLDAYQTPRIMLSAPPRITSSSPHVIPQVSHAPAVHPVYVGSEAAFI
jgi:hypothetical protein